MPVTTKEISTYAVSVISDADPNQFAGTIVLFDVAQNIVAFLRFYSPGSSMSPNEFRTDLGYPLVSYASTSLAPMIDVLRNEKPLYFIWFDYMPVRCFGAVATSRELVGESEP